MTTEKLKLTETANGQANYLNVNAALNALDQLVHQRVLDKDLAAPPGSPANGAAYIVAGSPTGAWAGKANQIAYWLTSAGAWSFLVPGPNDRWIVRVSDENLDYRWNGTAWAVHSAQFAGGTLSTALNEAPIVTLASASTVAIGAAAANTISISGTTTITAFDSIASGAVRRLVFQGALTLTHNGTSLILPTGASIVTAAGDVAEFVSLGSGNWRCFNYLRASGIPTGLGPSSSPTFNALTLTSGQISFPATQVPSADPNTLDDYEEGTWTPTLTFSTPGDLNVVYGTRTGSYTKVGRLVHVSLQIVTSTFTHTTAAGTVLVTGLPFTSNALSRGSTGMQWSGITKAGYTDVAASLPGSSAQIAFTAAASGSAFASVVAADMPSGGTINWTLSLVYFI